MDKVYFTAFRHRFLNNPKFVQFLFGSACHFQKQNTLQINSFILF